MSNVRFVTQHVQCFVLISVALRNWEMSTSCQHNNKKIIQQFWLAIHVNLCYQSTFLIPKFGWDHIDLSNFWHNIEETPDDFNDFSATKPAVLPELVLKNEVRFFEFSSAPKFFSSFYKTNALNLRFFWQLGEFPPKNPIFDWKSAQRPSIFHKIFHSIFISKLSFP